MADIFDLARSINARRKQASQGYASGFEDLPRQIMEVMDTKEKEQRVSLKNDSILLNQLIEGASTQQEIDNISKLATQYGKNTFSDPSTRLYGDVIGMKANQKKDAYNKFVASVEWFDSQLASDDKKSYFDISEEELQNMSLDDISGRIKELEGYTAGMELGRQNNFKYAKGNNSLETLQNQFSDYQQKLENTLKAFRTGNIITDEEAMSIILGDYEGSKKTAMASIKSNLSSYATQLKALEKERLNVKKKISESSGVEGFGADTSSLEANLEVL